MRQTLTLLSGAVMTLAAVSAPSSTAILHDNSRQHTSAAAIERTAPARTTATSPSLRIRSGRTHRSFGTIRKGIPPANVYKTAEGHAVSVAGSLLDQDAPGVYSYSFADNTFEPMALSDDLFANGNAILAGDTYICFSVEDYGWTAFVYIYKYDINTWEKTATGYGYIENVPIDMAADPVSGKIYGCFPKDSSYSGYIWAQYNQDSYSRASIAELTMPLTAVAADDTGQFYGIGLDGIMYKVEKESGQLSEVGDTGLTLASVPQSAAFDLQHNHMYLSAELEDGTTGLWKINTLTGNAELINEYPGNQILTGIYVPPLKADLGAPDKISDLTLDFAGGNTTGTVSFTLPSRTYGGSELTGPVNYSVRANGQEIKKGSGTAGTHVATTVEAPAGHVRFTVCASNSAGDGPEAEETIFVGKDAPSAVGDLKAEKDENGHITLSWTAPQTTLNGGYFDPSDLMYTVRRMPDDKLIAVTSATVCSDLISGDALTTWIYEVTPQAGGIEGPSAQSSPVVTGTYCTVPWSDDFSSDATFPLYTVDNVAGDRYTWVYSSSYGCVMCDYDFSNPKDDWLFTPALKMTADRTYRVRITTKTKRALPETLEVKYGNSPEKDAMTCVVIEPTTITSEDYSNPDIERTFEAYITPDADGMWNIGIHAMSEPQMNRIELHYIEVTEAGMALAPEAPSGLEAIPGADGALEAEVKFIAPDKAINGEKLTSLDRAEIYVNGALTATVTGPVPGESVSKTVPTLQGDNEIRVKAFNSAGQGLEATADVYTGVTIPATVTDLNAQYADGRITLTWTAPMTGEDGGYVDPETMTYMIMRSDRTILAYESKGTEFTDDLASFSLNGQGIVSYVVYPKNVAGTGYGTYSNGIVLGDAFFALPFKESFPQGFTSNTPWGITSTTETGWFITTKSNSIPNYDNDNGMAVFQPHGAGESSLIYTGRFRFARTVNPMFRMMFYNDRKSENRLEVVATSDYGNWNVIGTIDLADQDIPEGWNELKIPLNAFISTEPFVAFGIRGISAESDNWNHLLYIDCIEVYDELDHNLEIIEFDAPGSIAFGKSAAFGGVITNRGAMAADDYTIEIHCNGKSVASAEGTPVMPGEEATFEITVTPAFEDAPAALYKAVINYAADQNPENNSSDERNVLITTNDYPVVTDLCGKQTDDGGIALSWSAPEPGMAPELTVESFEDYIPFIIDNIGDWALVDIDGADGTFGITFGGTQIEFMNATYPHAYQVFNPEKCGLGSQTGLDAMLPRTGEQYLASFQDVDGLNDDWLISPRLSGNAQTVSFFVKTPIPNYGFETFEVYYSTSGKDITSFVKVDGIKEEAFIRWEQVAFNVPEGTEYFAIRHTSSNKFLLAIDDISFVGADAELKPLEIAAYNIYRDNIKIGSVGSSSMSFTDSTPEDKVHSYAVTVEYTSGESGYSNIILIDPSSVNNLRADSIAARGLEGEIVVTGAEGLDIRIYGADGRTVICASSVSGQETFSVERGIYLVTAGDRTFKVLVR